MKSTPMPPFLSVTFLSERFQLISNGINLFISMHCCSVTNYVGWVRLHFAYWVSKDQLQPSASLSFYVLVKKGCKLLCSHMLLSSNMSLVHKGQISVEFYRFKASLYLAKCILLKDVTLLIYIRTVWYVLIVRLKSR